MTSREIELTLSIPASVYARMQEVSQKAGYENINDFLKFILHELFLDDVEQQDQLEKMIIEQKLRDLGYL